MKQMLKFLERHKRESLLAPLFKMLEAVFDLLVPLVTANIINQGIAGRDSRYILAQCGLLLLLGVIGLACSVTAQYFAAKAAVEASAEVRHALFEKIQSLGFAEADSVGTGTLITRMTSDVNQLQNGLNMFLRLFLRSPVIVFGAILMAFTIDVKTAWIFVVILPVLSAVVYFIMRTTIPRYRGVQAKLDQITGITRENLTGVRVVRAFGREEDETERFVSADGELARSQIAVGRVSALLNPLTFAIINVGILAVLRTGALQINAGALAAGDVVALVNYMSQILLELVKLANLIVQLTRAAACTERINGVLALQPAMRYGETRLTPAAGENAVEFRHVGLRYGSGEESLSDISFTVQKEQTVGVIGGTGSGKTSLVSLLPRYYDATSGSVLLFGKDIRTYDRQSLRTAVSTVMQKAQLFSGTIRDNLTWGNPNATDEDLWQALTTAQAAEIVRGKPLGLNEPVEQSGRNFSGGQKQRLSIARSLVSRPAILILDDSASALDYATDAALRKALARGYKNTTAVIIAQRVSSIMNADRILVLDEGREIGFGTHRELMENCSMYNEIAATQMGAQGGELYE